MTTLFHDPVIHLCAAHRHLDAVVVGLVEHEDEDEDPDGTEVKVEAVMTVQIRIMELVVRTPATSPRGIAAKVELWHQTKRTWSDNNDVLMNSITSDLQAMWKED